MSDIKVLEAILFDMGFTQEEELLFFYDIKYRYPQFDVLKTVYETDLRAVYIREKDGSKEERIELVEIVTKYGNLAIGVSSNGHLFFNTLGRTV